MDKKQVVTINTMHTCPMTTGNTPHVGGPIIGPGCSTATLNGIPIALQGDKCICAAGGQDVILQGCPTATINGVPIALQGSPTAHGGTIPAGVPGAVIISKNTSVLEAGAEGEPAVYNLQWKKEDLIVQETKVEKVVTLVADTRNISDGEEVVVKVHTKEPDGGSTVVAELKGIVENNQVKVDWKVEENDDDENIKQGTNTPTDITNCVVYFSECSDYMHLEREERKGFTVPDNSKIYGFDKMKSEYKDIYGYYWNGDFEQENTNDGSKKKPINIKDPSAKYENLEKEYKPSIITWEKAKKDKNKYYMPWLSIANGQKVRLQITMKWDQKPKKLEWSKEYAGLFKLPDINKIQKGKQEITIECIGDITKEIELYLLADGKVAGRLGIVPNKKRTIKITWCLVDITGKDKKGRYTDIEALKNKLTQQQINRFVKYLGLSQALIEVDATETYKEIHLSDLGYTWDKYTKYPNYTYKGNAIINASDLQNDVIVEYERKYPKDEHTIVMFLYNKRRPTIKPDSTKKTITELEGQDVAGNAFDFGSKYLMLYTGFEDHFRIVIHEILHCLSLMHSFDKEAIHKFKAYETENFMDYVFKEKSDNRKHLWKWQWLQIWKYLDKMKSILFLLLLSSFINCNAQKVCTEQVNYQKYYELNYIDYIYYTYCFKKGIDHDLYIPYFPTEYDFFNHNLKASIAYSDEKPLTVENYLFKQKYKKWKQKKNMKIKSKRYLDRHINYLQYTPFNISDTLMAGRLIESYQKYDSVLIGVHNWYKYDRKKAKASKANFCKEITLYEVPIEIEKSVNYDTIYPICWREAIHIAHKKGLREKYPTLVAPKGYPEEKQPPKEAFWIVSDKRRSIKINAYTGEVIK